MGETGSTLWMFKHVALIEATKSGSFDPDEEAIEAGADEVEKNTESSETSYLFYGAHDSLASIQTALTGRGWKIVSAELSYKPNNPTVLDDAQRKDVEEFLNELDDHDDTSKVHATL